MTSIRPLHPNSATRVVVIDDDDFEREFLVDLLQQAGFDVSARPSVIGMTNHLVHERAHVVVLDVMMPTIRGDKLAQLLRKSPALPHLGVVLVSSMSESEVAPLMADSQADAFVSKSRVRSELAKVVANLATR